MKLSSFVEKFRGKKILVVGDLMVDEYFAGAVSRISPEAPVPIVDVEKHFFVCGGAANVAANISSLGGVPLLAGAVGKDHAASQLHWLLKTQGISSLGLFLEGGRVTTVKTRVIAHNQQVVRFDQEHRSSISRKTEEKIVSFIEKAASQADAAVLSDYDKGVITPRVAQAFLSACRENGIPTAADSKNFLFLKLEGMSVLKPNISELRRETGIAIEDDASLDEAVRVFFSNLSPQAVAVTRGEKGMSIYEAGAKRVDIPAVAAEVFDVSGAGDTVLAALSLGLASGASFLESAKLANYAASIVVRKIGTATASPEELKKAIG